MKFVNLKMPDGSYERRKVHIIVWSGGGEVWARQVAAAIGIQKYVDQYAAKNLVGRDEAGHPVFEPGLQPDVAVDDIQDCKLGVANLIVREK